MKLRGNNREKGIDGLERKKQRSQPRVREPLGGAVAWFRVQGTRS